MGVVKTHSTVLDGVTYKIPTYPASLGLELMRKLASLVDDGVLTLILGVDDADLGDVLTNPATMFAVVKGAASQAKPGEFGDIAKQLCQGLTADKIQIGEAQGSGSVIEHFDTHFAGRYAHLFEVVVWAARVGFGGP